MNYVMAAFLLECAQAVYHKVLVVHMMTILIYLSAPLLAALASEIHIPLIWGPPQLA